MNNNPHLFLKSLFRIKNDKSESEHHKLQRYGRYFQRLNKKSKKHECDLIDELHDLCSNDPTIDGNIQELVDELYDIFIGGD